MASESKLKAIDLPIDIKAAQAAMAVFTEAGQKLTSVKELLAFALPRIENWKDRLEQMKAYANVREECNNKELATRLDVSRQTIYNWKEWGYIVYKGTKVDIPGTIQLWEELDRQIGI